MDADLKTLELAQDAPRRSMQRLVREFVDARMADCMEVMAQYPDGHFDLAIVDPPYGINVGDNKSGMGRRKGDAKAKYKMGDWDSQPPPSEYFEELRRVSKNQIIWGANHYIERMAWNSPCWIIWDKLYSNDVSFAAVEMAWTSFRTTAKKFECTPLQAARIHGETLRLASRQLREAWPANLGHAHGKRKYRHRLPLLPLPAGDV
ncbi:MAG: hypothetical protein NTV52_02895 [Acidobacteria bacterium]|nr:hypothetical protein [Acidobacteriota bacterium]